MGKNGEQMRAIEFDSGWTCKHLNEKGAGAPVRIPHDAMLQELRTDNAKSGVNGCWFEGFDYLYEKQFTVGEELREKNLVLEFEGVYRKAEIWINGKIVASRPYGYTNFYVDMTEYVKIGEQNLIQVIARNQDQPNSRWYSGAGIYRPVKLWISEKNHILMNGVRVHTLSVDPAKVEISIKTSSQGNLQIDILDENLVIHSENHETNGEISLNISLMNVELWSTNNPKLYFCRVRFEKDEHTVAFGIRSLSWGEDGLKINGTREILRGACIHHDNGILGAACWYEAVERKIRILQENGYNAIRSAHNPCSKALLDVCDKLGMLVMDEYIDHWYIHKTRYDYVEYFERWWKQDLSDMVDKDYNHPCVILYSTGNEVSETAEKKGIDLTWEMTDYLHKLDNSRAVTCGINIFFNFLSSIGFGVYSDEKANNEAEKAVGSAFFNEMAGLFGDKFMKIGATLHGCDVKTRDAFAGMDIAGYNYGIYRYKKDLKKYPKRLILGSETFCNDAYAFWEHAKKEPRLIGDFVWAGMDYLGEVGIGSWEYKDYAPDFTHKVGWISAGSGRIDLTGKPLGEAIYTKVAFELEQGPRIAVCPVNHSSDKHSPSAWKMSNAIESWSFEGHDGEIANVEVYARAHSIELFVNDTLVGKKKVKKNCITKFRCKYVPGKIEAVSYDMSGIEINRSSLISAGPKTFLIAEPEKDTAKKGELSFIRLKYVDDKGILKPLCRGNLKVQLKGGKLIGLGSACPFYLQSYLDDETDTYFGEALAAILPEQEGEMRFTVSDGLYTDQICIQVN